MNTWRSVPRSPASSASQIARARAASRQFARLSSVIFSLSPIARCGEIPVDKSTPPRGCRSSHRSNQRVRYRRIESAVERSFWLDIGCRTCSFAARSQQVWRRKKRTSDQSVSELGIRRVVTGVIEAAPIIDCSLDYKRPSSFTFTTHHYQQLF